MTWTPAPARTFVLPTADAQPRNYVRSAATLRWPDKSALERLDYSVDYRNILQSDETFIDAAVSARPAGDVDLALGPLAITGTIVTVWIEDGSGATDYLVRLTVKTNYEREFETVMKLYITAAAAGAPFGPITQWRALILQTLAQWMFWGSLVGVAQGQPYAAPAYDFRVPLNAGMLGFHGTPTDGVFTPLHAVVVPSFDFRSARNAALLGLRGAVADGIFTPLAIVVPVPAFDFRDARNAALLGLRGALVSAAFTPY